MTFTRIASLALAALLFAGCQSDPEQYLPEAEPRPDVETDSASMAELIDRGTRTADLGVGRLKDPAKTVGFAAGSTEVGEKLFEDALVVDQVTRQDADNHFGVTVTLFNDRDDAPALFEWRITFFNAQGAEVGSLHSDWKSKAIDAKRWGTVSNSATLRGATTFKVEARVPERRPEPAPEKTEP